MRNIVLIFTRRGKTKGALVSQAKHKQVRESALVTATMPDAEQSEEHVKKQVNII